MRKKWIEGEGRGGEEEVEGRKGRVREGQRGRSE